KKKNLRILKKMNNAALSSLFPIFIFIIFTLILIFSVPAFSQNAYIDVLNSQKESAAIKEDINKENLNTKEEKLKMIQELEDEVEKKEAEIDQLNEKIRLIRSTVRGTGKGKETKSR